MIVEEEIGGERVTDCNAENLPGPRFESGSKDAVGNAHDWSYFKLPTSNSGEGGLEVTVFNMDIIHNKAPIY